MYFILRNLCCGHRGILVRFVNGSRLVGAVLAASLVKKFKWNNFCYIEHLNLWRSEMEGEKTGFN